MTELALPVPRILAACAPTEADPDAAQAPDRMWFVWTKLESFDAAVIIDDTIAISSERSHALQSLLPRLDGNRDVRSIVLGAANASAWTARWHHGASLRPADFEDVDATSILTRAAIALGVPARSDDAFVLVVAPTCGPLVSSPALADFMRALPRVRPFILSFETPAVAVQRVLANRDGGYYVIDDHATSRHHGKGLWDFTMSIEPLAGAIVSTPSGSRTERWDVRRRPLGQQGDAMVVGTTADEASSESPLFIARARGRCYHVPLVCEVSHLARPTARPPMEWVVRRATAPHELPRMPRVQADDARPDDIDVHGSITLELLGERLVVPLSRALTFRDPHDGTALAKCTVWLGELFFESASADVRIAGKLAEPPAKWRAGELVEIDDVRIRLDVAPALADSGNPDVRRTPVLAFDGHIVELRHRTGEALVRDELWWRGRKLVVRGHREQHGRREELDGSADLTWLETLQFAGTAYRSGEPFAGRVGVPLRILAGTTDESYEATFLLDPTGTIEIEATMPSGSS